MVTSWDHKQTTSNRSFCLKRSLADIYASPPLPPPPPTSANTVIACLSCDSDQVQQSVEVNNLQEGRKVNAQITGTGWAPHMST